MKNKVIKQADVKNLLENKDIDGLVDVLLHGGTRSMQMDAAVALGKLNSKKAIEPLIEAVNNPYYYPDVRVYAIQSLAKIGGKKASKTLQEATRDGDESVRETAKSMLYMFSDSLSNASPDDSQQRKRWWQFWK